jgi:hypothetical protein
VCITAPDNKFTNLESPRRIWAVSAVHAEADRLMALHDELYQRILPGDRVVYLGNYTGYGPSPRETVDELLTFRRLAMSLPGMKASDIIYLRGGQEEMLEKLLQLQFAPNPVHVLLWMLGHGMAGTLASYGLSQHDGIVAAQEGVIALGRWTKAVRDAIRRRPGHEIFQTCLRRAAYTSDLSPWKALFVNSGIDTGRSLDEQSDSLWWNESNFNAIALPYAPYEKVVRGFDPKHGGIHINCVTATIDGGCGFGGSLVCAQFEANGEMSGLLEY